MPGPLTTSEQNEVDLTIGKKTSGQRSAWCREVLEYLGKFKWAPNTADWASDAPDGLPMNCWCAPIYIAHKKGRLSKKTVDDFSMKPFQYGDLSLLHASQRAAHNFLKGSFAGGDEGVPGDLQFFYIKSLDGLAGKDGPKQQMKYNKSVPMKKCPVHVAVNMGAGKSVSLWSTPNNYDNYQYCETRDLINAIAHDRKSPCNMTSVEPFWIAGQKTKKKCYITTATCAAQGLPDDCAELEALRWFRDEIVLATPEGAAQVAEYYATAPAIVARIDRRPDSAAVYADIHQRYILPSVDAVAKAEFGRAHAIFAAMVRRLAAEHGPS